MWTDFLSLTLDLYNTAEAIMVPETGEPMTLIHYAIWTPITIGMLGLIVGFFKSLIGRGGRR